VDKQTGVGEVIAEISSALRGVAHDRWQLGGLHEGRLWIIADSKRTRLEAGARCTRLSSLARACLLDRCPVTVNNVYAPDPHENLRDWELDWPSLVYVPVATRGGRGVGVLLLGSRSLRAYEASDLSFLADLGEVIAPWLRRFLADNAAGFRRRAA
jgi:GAF domain-containing protein